MMNREEIKRVIPHREPMLLVDTVEKLDFENNLVVTTFWVDPGMDIFRGHFPGDPILPGIYSVECIAQSGNILLLSMERYAGKVPLFLGIDRVRFLKKILPGDTVTMHVSLLSERRDKAIVTCHGEIFCRGELAVVGDVTSAMR